MGCHTFDLLPEKTIMEEFGDAFRNRILGQKFCYHGDGAKLYYDKESGLPEELNPGVPVSGYVDFGRRHVFPGMSVPAPTALVSLGSGNGYVDKAVLGAMASGTPLDWFGVDSSSEMIALAGKEMVGCFPADCSFVHADFSAAPFRGWLASVTSKYPKRLFAFFNNTFANIYHTNIVDILRGLMEKGERIWLDVLVRDGDSPMDNLRALEGFSEYVRHPLTRRFYMNPLTRFGITDGDGDIMVRSKEIPALKALVFRFSFGFKRKTVIRVNDEEVIALPGEEVKLTQIYTYDIPELVRFFEEHEFRLVADEPAADRRQMLFEKR